MNPNTLETYESHQSQQSLPRLGWVDCAKGLGIILVVYGHVAIGIKDSDLLQQTDAIAIPLIRSLNLVYSFHMALFFALSGMFANVKAAFSLSEFKDFISKKAVSILYPYLVWSILQGGVHSFISTYTNTDSDLLSLPYRLLFAPIAQFWFLYVLFFYHLAFTTLSRTFSPKIILLFSMLLFLFSPHINVGIIKGFSQYFIYFVLGFIAIKPIVNWFNRLTMVDLALAACCGMVSLLAAFSLSSLAFGLNFIFAFNQHYWLILLLSILGSFSILCFSLMVGNTQSWIRTSTTYLGKLSMPIYLTHILAAAGARIFLSNILNVTSIWAHLWVGMLFGLVIPVLLYELSVSRLPWLFTWSKK